jgi:hypothetical protein
MQHYCCSHARPPTPRPPPHYHRLFPPPTHPRLSRTPQLDREVRKIEREEAKCQKEIKKYAKAGQMGPAKTMAKSLVQMRGQKLKFITMGANLKSVEMQMTAARSLGSMGAAMKRATGAMVMLNRRLNPMAMQVHFSFFTSHFMTEYSTNLMMIIFFAGDDAAVRNGSGEDGNVGGDDGRCVRGRL